MKEALRTVKDLQEIISKAFTAEAILFMKTPQEEESNTQGRIQSTRLGPVDQIKKVEVATKKYDMSFGVPIIKNVSTPVETVQGENIIYLDWIQGLTGYYDKFHAIGSQRDDSLYVTIKPGNYEE